MKNEAFLEKHLFSIERQHVEDIAYAAPGAITLDNSIPADICMRNHREVSHHEPLPPEV